ncbi:MAG: peptidoglycan bridge formation glycyltransferase FemA/FemB family protein, partial [Clostridiales bacterium]|nr:peptidoglycan bridge formation glycyltransferase FemA/FemB family protein [Clostridiales bacterium]
PHGPIWDWNDLSAFNQIMQEVGELGKKYKCYSCIIDPCITENDSDVIKYLNESGLVFKKNAEELQTIQARNNYMLFLNGRNEEEIFASFHKKWRYNIRLSERRGVVCKVCGKESLDDFHGLMAETGKRDGFAIRSKEYFESMLDSLGENCRLYMCYSQEGIPLSGAVTSQYAGKTCYIYGASSNENRNLMANHFMQWNMIQWAIQNNCELYDFQGIPFYTDETHPNYGVYRFKKGFNGEVVTYAGEFHKIYKPVINKIVKIFLKLRWFKNDLYRRILLLASKKKEKSVKQAKELNTSSNKNQKATENKDN